MRPNSIFSQGFNKSQKRIIDEHTKAAAEKQANIKAFVRNKGSERDIEFYSARLRTGSGRHEV